jgi:hypothetical protein
MPARHGDWRSRGSVEVTQFQRRVLSQAEKSFGSSKPFFPTARQASSLRT